jgi:hypothetical protein
MTSLSTNSQLGAAMPLTEGDVLDTLGDSVALNMDFWVVQVHVSGKYYGIIREHILAENILVVPGDKPTLAFYDQKTDILTTQAGNSPANLGQRALLLHECTHATNDIFAGNVTRHIDELSAYIAQEVYTTRSAPSLSGDDDTDTTPGPPFSEQSLDWSKAKVSTRSRAMESGSARKTSNLPAFSWPRSPMSITASTRKTTRPAATV